jgi:hypothetical protein
MNDLKTNQDTTIHSVIVSGRDFRWSFAVTRKLASISPD